MSRRNIQNYDEQRLSSDINQEQLFSSADLQNILMALLTPDGAYPASATPSGGILGGFQVTPGTGLVAIVNVLSATTSNSGLVPAIGFQFDPTNLVGASNADASTPSIPGAGINPSDSPFRIFFLNANASLALTAADPTNPRIDLIEIQWNQTVSNKTTRNILTSPGVLPWVPTSVYKEQEPDCTIVVKTGTPAGSPVAPSVDANFMPLATVYVAANATGLIQANITDKRPLVSLPIRNGNQIIATDGTVHTLSVIQTAPGIYTLKID